MNNHEELKKYLEGCIGRPLTDKEYFVLRVAYNKGYNDLLKEIKNKANRKIEKKRNQYKIVKNLGFSSFEIYPWFHPDDCSDIIDIDGKQILVFDGRTHNYKGRIVLGFEQIKPEPYDFSSYKVYELAWMGDWVSEYTGGGIYIILKNIKLTDGRICAVSVDEYGFSIWRHTYSPHIHWQENDFNDVDLIYSKDLYENTWRQELLSNPPKILTQEQIKDILLVYDNFDVLKEKLS